MSGEIQSRVCRSEPTLRAQIWRAITFIFAHAAPLTGLRCGCTGPAGASGHCSGTCCDKGSDVCVQNYQFDAGGSEQACCALPTATCFRCHCSLHENPRQPAYGVAGFLTANILRSERRVPCNNTCLQTFEVIQNKASLPKLMSAASCAVCWQPSQSIPTAGRDVLRRPSGQLGLLRQRVLHRHLRPRRPQQLLLLLCAFFPCVAAVRDHKEQHAGHAASSLSSTKLTRPCIRHAMLAGVHTHTQLDYLDLNCVGVFLIHNPLKVQPGFCRSGRQHRVLQRHLLRRLVERLRQRLRLRRHRGLLCVELSRAICYPP